MTWLRIRAYLLRVWVAWDQLWNTILGGDEDETISSRLGKWRRLPRSTWRWRVAYVICRALHWIDREHCERAIEEDEG